MLKRIGLVFLLLLAASLALSGETHAATAATAAEANGGLAACERQPAGKATRDCVADVLDKLAAQSARPETARALSNAAAGLRAAVNRAQAVLAITQCHAVISAALKEASGRVNRRGTSAAQGLDLVVAVVSRAVRLIQRKG